MNLQGEMNGNESLIGDQDALAKDFNLSLSSFASYDRKHPVQTFVVPFPVDVPNVSSSKSSVNE